MTEKKSPLTKKIKQTKRDMYSPRESHEMRQLFNRAVRVSKAAPTSIGTTSAAEKKAIHLTVKAIANSSSWTEARQAKKVLRRKARKS